MAFRRHRSRTSPTRTPRPSLTTRWPRRPTAPPSLPSWNGSACSAPSFIRRSRPTRDCDCSPTLSVSPGKRADMLARRIIACLDVRDGQVVKGVNFRDLRGAGDAAELAARYNAAGIDELIFLDISATLEGRRALSRTIAAIAAQLFIPLAAGGGIRSLDDAKAALDAGADKVSINSAALLQPQLITTLAATYGSQAVVVAIDARRAARAGAYDVLSRAGTQLENVDAIAWAREAAD